MKYNIFQSSVIWRMAWTVTKSDFIFVVMFGYWQFLSLTPSFSPSTMPHIWASWIQELKCSFFCTLRKFKTTHKKLHSPHPLLPWKCQASFTFWLSQTIFGMVDISFPTHSSKPHNVSNIPFHTLLVCWYVCAWLLQSWHLNQVLDGSISYLKVAITFTKWESTIFKLSSNK